jgi:unsaturated chondroitin disaccharide hydrolase
MRHSTFAAAPERTVGTTAWLDASIARAVDGTRRLAATATAFPHIVDHGAWQFTPDGVWTGGFWAGCLWLAARSADDAPLRAQAIDATERLLPRVHDARNHDLGFMFYPSAVAAWRATDDARYLDAAKTAAASLAAQFDPAAGYIPGWGFFGGEAWRGSVLVDTLMNLPLLVLAARHEGGPHLLDVVRGQVATTLGHHLRADGSVYHVYRFDPATHAALGGATYQGLGAESAWSRGQAWAITGLAILASMLGDQTYRAASARVAEYFMAHLPADGVPPWDFMADPASAPKDASAGAIAAYGLLRLYELTGEARWLDATLRLALSLRATCENRDEGPGLLLHATADLPHGLGVDGATMYGDYYWFKLLVRLRQVIATRHLDAEVTPVATESQPT